MRINIPFGNRLGLAATMVAFQLYSATSFAAPAPINIDFGEGLLGSAKVGLAAVGQSASDFWNFYTRDDGAGVWRTFGVVSNLKRADGTATTAGLTVANAPGSWGNGSSDPMYVGYLYPFSGNATLTLTNLVAGQYDVYLYANDGNYQLAVDSVEYGVKTCHDVALASPPVWQEGVQYVRFGKVTVNEGKGVVVTARPGLSGYAVISGMQVVRTGDLPPSRPAFLMNIDLGAGLSGSAKVGPAAVGQNTIDFWNFYTRDDGAGNWRTFGVVSNLKTADGTPTAAGLTVANAPGAWGTTSSDAMYVGYIYPFNGVATLTVTNLPVGAYDLYLYSPDGKYEVASGSMNYGVKSCVDGAPSGVPVWQEGVQYARFQNVTVTNSSEPVVLTVRPGIYGYAVISGLQIAASAAAASNSGPTLVSQPVSQTVYADANVSFSVTATGTALLNYQWRWNGTNLAGATTSSLTLNNVQVADAGNYSVQVTNAVGAVVTSTNAALVVVQTTTNRVINVNFGAHRSPGLDANKTGPAAIGQTAGDFWNFYSRDDAHGNWQVNGALTGLQLADGTTTPSGLIVSNSPGCWAAGSSDPMYNTYIYPFNGLATVTVTNLPAGQYDLYVYSVDGNYQVTVGGVSSPVKTTRDQPVNNPTIWQEGRQYARFQGVAVAAGQAVTLTVQPGVSGYAIISGLQLVYVAPLPSAASPFLVDVDFGGGLNGNGKVGFAAVGQTTNDFWNFYTRDDGAGHYRTFGVVTNLKTAAGTATAAGLTVANAPGAWGNGSSDPMYNGYLYPFSGNATITVTNLPTGRYDIYVYSSDGNYQVGSGSVNYGVKSCVDGAPSRVPVWQEGVQYARFQNVTVTNSSEPVVLTVRPGIYGYAVISGLQIAQATENRGTSELGRLSLLTVTDGSVRVSFIAVPAQRYRVQASTDLKDWVDLGGVLADDNGNCAFSDRDSQKFPSRYYRIVLP